MDQRELRPLAPGAGTDAIVQQVNNLIYLLRGTNPDWMRLEGFGGTYVNPDASVASSPNPALFIKPAAGITAIETQDSAGNTTFVAYDGGATVNGTLTVNGDASFTKAPYTSFTPSVAQGAAPTMTITRARYRIDGKSVNVDISMTVASGTGTASNAIIVTIPSAIQAAASGQALGVMQVTDVSAGAFYAGVAVSASGTTIACYTNAAAGLLGATGSAMTAALAAPDVVRLNLTYETA